MKRLPHWCITDMHPAFYDTESKTTIEMVGRVYMKTNELIDEYNTFVEELNKKIDEFESTNEEEYEMFKTSIRQEYQNFMDAIDVKLSLWNTQITNHIDEKKIEINHDIEDFKANVNERVTQQNEQISGVIEDVQDYKKEITNRVSQHETTVSDFTQIVNRTMFTMETDHNNFKTEMQNQYNEFLENVDPVIPDRVDYDENNSESASYIRNRPFYEEHIAGGVVAENISIAFKSEMMSGTGIGIDNIVAGETYEVTFKGEKYTCTAVEESQSIMLGNIALNSGSVNTGEPFCIECIGANSFMCIKDTSTTETVTISVSKPDLTILKQFSGKFMEDGYYTEKGKLINIYPLTQLTYDEEDAGYAGQNFPTLEVGSTYIINYNGVDYTVDAVDASALHSGAVYFGNGEMVGLQPSNHPFLGVVFENVLMFITFDGATTATISVSGFEEIVHKIPKKYIPENDEPITTFKMKSANGYIWLVRINDNGELDAYLE